MSKASTSAQRKNTRPTQSRPRVRSRSPSSTANERSPLNTSIDITKDIGTQLIAIQRVIKETSHKLATLRDDQQALKEQVAAVGEQIEELEETNKHASILLGDAISSIGLRQLFAIQRPTS